MDFRSTTQLKYRILLQALLPAIGIIVIVNAALSYLYSQKLHAQLDAQARATTLQLVDSMSQPSTQDLPQRLQQALEYPNLRAIHLYDNQGQDIAHSGPIFNTQRALPAPAGAAPLRIDLGQHHYVTQSIPQLGWIAVEFERTNQYLSSNQFILVNAALTLAGFIVLSLLAVRLQHELTQSIRHISTTIRKLSSGELTARAAPDINHEFQRLALAVNQMADTLEHSQQELQGDIDHATTELQETLDTLEVQSVELDIARKKALESSQLKSEFLANTSHEIRTPLNGIVGFTQLLLKTEMNQEQQEFLQNIQNSSQDLLTLFNDILDFSKLEMGQLKLDYIAFELRSSIESIFSILASQAEEKQQELVLLIAPEIPTHLLGDPLRFKQIINSLLNNAIRFTEQGVILVEITLLQQTDNNVALKVSVSDQGCGIPEEVQQNLFDAFTQADGSSAREHQGTGLGLAIAKGLVERMSGEIGVDSQEQQGSTFWFTAQMGIDQNNTQHPPQPLANVAILLHSHNIKIQQQLQQLLRPTGAATTPLTELRKISPTIAQSHNQGHPPQLLILDLPTQQESINSKPLRQLITHIEQNFHCKTLLLANPRDRQKLEEICAGNGAANLSKPLTQQRLQQAIYTLLELSPSNSDTISSVASAKPARVLAVDDNPANLRLLSELLSSQGCLVSTATNGLEAVEAATETSFDVIFMDIQMPGLNGIQATEKIRLHEQDSQQRTPIVALTADALDDKKTKLLLAGLDDYLAKPVADEQLRHVIKRWSPQTQIGALEPRPEQPPITAPNHTDDHGSPINLQSKIQSPITATQQSQPVDINQSLQLANNKQDLAKDMLNMLLTSLPAEQSLAQQAYQQQDFKSLEEITHRIHGGCCYCGVPSLKQASKQLEGILQQEQFEQLDTAMGAFEGAIETLLEWQEQHDLDSLFEA